MSGGGRRLSDAHVSLTPDEPWALRRLYARVRRTAPALTAAMPATIPARTPVSEPLRGWPVVGRAVVLPVPDAGAEGGARRVAVAAATLGAGPITGAVPAAPATVVPV